MKGAERREEEARVIQEVASRAVRRLGVAEWVLLAGAQLLAIAGGGLVAFLLAPLTGVPFRVLWIVLSLAFFVVPGVLVLVRSRRDAREQNDVVPDRKR